MARTRKSPAKQKAKATSASKPPAKKPAKPAKKKAAPAKKPAAPVRKKPAKAAPVKKPAAPAKPRAKSKPSPKKKPPKARLVKILLHASGEDAETPWATDLGPAPGIRGARRVRLDNVPFLHAKPTYGDEIIVVPGEGFLTWDRGDADPDRGDRIAHDGGRYALIVDYQPAAGAAAQPVFAAICAAARTEDIVPEGCFGPRDGKPGRAYFAAPAEITPPQLMTLLAGGVPGCDFTLIHPE